MSFKRCIVFLIVFACASCKREIPLYLNQYIDKGLKTHEAPFTTPERTTFHANIVYGKDKRNTYDFFKPNYTQSSSLVVLIHGGGFVTGDKQNYYSSHTYTSFIQHMLANNIAVATVNYRYRDATHGAGILRSMKDVQKAIQHIQTHAEMLHVDAEKTVLYGGSAGAMTAMWLGFQRDTIADVKIQGIVAVNTQASYDIMNWDTTIFSDFTSEGFNAESIENIVGEPLMLATYGVSTREKLASSSVQAYVHEIDILQKLSADDPELYVITEDFENTIPETISALYHHPKHVATIYKKATAVGAKGLFYCPAIDLNTTNGESVEEFIIRKIGTTN